MDATGGDYGREESRLLSMDPVRRPPTVGPGDWAEETREQAKGPLHISFEWPVQLLCRRLLTSPSLHMTTFPSQKAPPRSAKLEWRGPIIHPSVLSWTPTLSGSAAQNREPGKDGWEQDGL